MRQPKQLATFACMIMCGDGQQVNGVYQGIVRTRKNGEKYIRFDESTKQIATVISRGGDHVETIHKLAREYATPEAPAMDF